MLFREEFEQVFTLQTLIAGGVFVLVVGVLVVVVARKRARRREHLPFAARENNALEIGVSVLLAGVAATLVWVSLSANARLGGGAGVPRGWGGLSGTSRLGGGTGVAEATEGRPAAQISVTAFRWWWDFDYRGATPVRVTRTCHRAQAPPDIV